jgi:DNA polymerase-3 subunit epsilon
MNLRLRRLVALNDTDRLYNRAQADLDAGWRDQNYLAVDLETTGLDTRNDQIVSYGAVPIIDGRIRFADAVSGYVKPTREISADAIRVHGLRRQDLDTAPPIGDCIDSLLPAMTGRVVVAHCGWIERAFLSRAMHTSSAAVFHNPIVDTARLAHRWLGSPATGDFGESIALELLARTLDMPVHCPHDALSDALTTAQVFLALVNRLEATAGPLTVRSLTRLSAQNN